MGPREAAECRSRLEAMAHASARARLDGVLEWLETGDRSAAQEHDLLALGPDEAIPDLIRVLQAPSHSALSR